MAKVYVSYQETSSYRGDSLEKGKCSTLILITSLTARFLQLNDLTLFRFPTLAFQMHFQQEQGTAYTLSGKVDAMNYVSVSVDKFFQCRMTGSYLGRKFLHKKRRKEEQVLNLSCLLAGKTKKESTIMFYEMLVI